MLKTRHSAPLLVAGALFAGMSARSLACFCLPVTVQQMLGTSEAVFRGTVISVTPAVWPEWNPTAHLQVSLYWKDASEVFSSQMDVRDGVDPSTCGSGLVADWAVGKSWLVFARANSSGYYSSFCFLTCTWATAERRSYDLDLGEPIRVLPVESQSWSAVKALY